MSFPCAEVVSRLFTSMHRIRRVEEEVERVYPDDKIQSPVHLSIGQESVAAGVCEALQPHDVVYGTYRGHAMYLAKGGDLREMVAELYAKQTGCAKGKGGSMHLVNVQRGVMGTSAIVATTIPLAVGHALAIRAQGKDAVVVSFFGDGATEEGVFYESLNFAVVKQLPILFVCENNSLAIHARLSARQPSIGSIFERAGAFGMPAERLANGDVLEIFQRAQAVTAEMRSGSRGPHLLECQTYRWRRHVGPGEDYQYGYRARDEADAWLASDQVERLGSMLPPGERQSIEAQVEREVIDAFRFAEESPFPDPDAELYVDVY